MNLEKAIEINNSILDGTYDHRDEDMETALQLGIEALKWFKEWRAPQYPAPYIRLPGETEE